MATSFHLFFNLFGISVVFSKLSNFQLSRPCYSLFFFFFVFFFFSSIAFDLYICILFKSVQFVPRDSQFCRNSNNKSRLKFDLLKSWSGFGFKKKREFVGILPLEGFSFFSLFLYPIMGLYNGFICCIG